MSNSPAHFLSSAEYRQLNNDYNPVRVGGGGGGGRGESVFVFVCTGALAEITQNKCSKTSEKHVCAFVTVYTCVQMTESDCICMYVFL